MVNTRVSIVLHNAADVMTARNATDCKGEKPPISIPHSSEGMNTSPTNNRSDRAGVKARVIAFVKKGRNASNLDAPLPFRYSISSGCCRRSNT